jgi:hypothetical protein
VAGAVAGDGYDGQVSQTNGKVEPNGKIERLTADEVAALTTPAQATTSEERRAAMRRATEGLRAEVRVTTSMYRRR